MPAFMYSVPAYKQRKSVSQMSPDLYTFDQGPEGSGLKFCTIYSRGLRAIWDATLNNI